MTDNIDVQPAELPNKVTVATDDILGIHHPFFKMETGVDGVATPVSGENPLPVASGSTSTLNSTSTPLTGAATFTGTGEQNDLSSVGVYAFSDVAGTIFFDWSVNGTDWHPFPTAGYPSDAGIPHFHTAVKLGRHFRVRYINGASAQSTFRLTIYYGNDFVPSVSPLNQPVSLDSDSLLVRPTFPWLDVVRGLTSGVSFINKFGKNAACAAGDTIDISSTAIDLPATAELCNIVSTSTDDDGAPEGIGAFTVLVQGLDENYDLTEETVTLNGTTDVPTVNKYWFVYRMVIMTGSTYTGALGAVTCTSTDSGSAVMATIAIGANQTQTANYQIPAGHTGYLNLPQVTLQNTNNNSIVELVLYNRRFGGVDNLKLDYLLQSGSVADYQQKEFGAPLTFNQKDIIYWKVISNAVGTSVVTVDYDIWLVNET